jgi:hypothetical protein
LVHRRPHLSASLRSPLSRARKPLRYLTIDDAVALALKGNREDSKRLVVGTTVRCATRRPATGNARIQRWVHTGFNPAGGSAAEVFVKRSDAVLRDRMPVTLRSRPGIAIAMRTYEAARDLLTSQQKAYKLGSIVSPRIHGRGCWGSRVETILLAALHVFSHAPYLVGRLTRVATLVGRCGGAPME